MNRRHLLLALSLLLLGLGLTPTTAAADSRVFVDSAGRTVELPDRIDRVMAAGPPASVLLYALAPDKMVGWVRKFSPEEKALIAEPYRDLPVHGRLTGKGKVMSPDEVKALRPALILDVGTVDATYAALADRVQADTGVPYVLIDGAFADTPETLRKLGELLGETERAQQLAGYAEAKIAKLRETLVGIAPDQRPRIYYGRGPNGLETAGAGSINAELFSAVGATNVAAPLKSGGLVDVTVEQMRSWNPDVILTLDSNFQKSALEDPQWSDVAAVAHKRVYRAPAPPFGWIDSPPGVNRLIGIDWLLSVLYPEVAPRDLRQQARDFYKLFYHVDLSGTQIDALLSESASKN